LKYFRPTRQLLAEIRRVLAQKPSVHESAIDAVIELLISGRHYSWAGLYLALNGGGQQALAMGGDHPEHMALPQTRSKILISVKTAGRELGVLSVENDRANFRAEDRVLLENVADALARFLSGPGKYLVRKAREQTAKPASNSPARVPNSTAAKPTRSAAAGDK
jgi:putative methionine-R-sulfoxide reductase with GAF domain